MRRWVLAALALCLIVLHASLGVRAQAVPREEPPKRHAGAGEDGVPVDNQKTAELFDLSSNAAKDEKRGKYHKKERIQIFEKALTSTNELLTKNPSEKDYGFNCMGRTIRNLEQDKAQLGHTRKINGANAYYSAYQIVSTDDRKLSRPHEICKFYGNSEEPMKHLRMLIHEQYRRNLLLPDGLPVMRIVAPADGEKTYKRISEQGLEIGYLECADELCAPDEFTYHVFTKWTFVLIRKSVDAETFSILRAYAYPIESMEISPTASPVYSVAFNYVWNSITDDTIPETIIDVSPTSEQKEAIALQWVIGIMVVLFATAMTGVILIRTIFTDIRLANKDIGDFLVSDEEKLIETGWKLVYADVFRTPRNAILLCASIGFGFQVVATLTLSSIAGAITWRDIKYTSFLGEQTLPFMIYIFSGTFSGYLSARFYKSFSGERWKLNVVLTHGFYPLILAAIMSIFQISILATKNSNAGMISGTRFFSALAVWILVGFPLTFLGAFFGFKREAFEYPVRTNLIPRQIPTQSFANKLIPRAFIGGGVVFLSFFIQFFFISDRLHHKHEYSWSMVFASILSAIVCAEMGVVNTYRQLIAENYQWWWQSIFIVGFSGVYFFGALFLFFLQSGFTKSTDEEGSDELVGAIAFLTQALVSSICVGLMNGFISFMASWIFVRKLYAAVRID